MKPSDPHDREVRLWPFLLAALLLHLAMGPSLMRFLKPTLSSKPIARVQIVPMNSATPRPSAQPPPKITPEHPEKPEEAPKGQVVDLPPSPDQRIPDNARYLSERNSRVERETRSRHQSSDYKNAMNEPTSQKQNSQPQAGDPKDKRVRGENSPHLGADKQTLIPDQRQNFQLQLQLDPDGKLRNQAQNSGTKGNSDRLEIGKLNSNSQKSLPSSLMPQLGVLARINGAPANDYLEKVEEGEGTFLNAKEFKYASFFNRLKQGVSQYWRPMDEFLRRDPTGNIYGNKTRVTILSVTLRADGHLKQLAVAQSSGLDFLDHEAELAFQKAEPFLNPPKGLVNAQGDIHFPFGFYLQLEGTQGF